ncbi:unnamed protein product [Colias eurytheme]|nr:unnamed protein product [Colias eurytheme]
MSPKKHLRSQGKEIISKVYHRMKYEAENGVENLTDARWRTAQAVGYSEHTISNILKEEKQAGASTSTGMAHKIFKSPSKRKRVCPKSTLDDFDTSVLRRTIMSFHVEFNEMPTLKKLKQVLSEKIGFDGCIETLRTILQKSGFEWSTTDDNRKILVEKHDIQMLRFKYLNQLKKYRDEGRYIVYTDESYVHTTHVQNKCWKSVKEVSPLQKKLSKGMRVIIVHAGGCQGFVPNACLIYKANSTTGDYHDNMNFENYKTWLTKQLLPNLPKNSVIIMDNASYHNVVSEKCPNSNSNKSIMQEWLTEKNIPFEESMKKIELYDIILKNKDRFQRFAIDELVRSKGHEILRLPPYHPELNPIEKIWGILKNYVDKKNLGQNMTSIMALIKERMEMIDSSMWENTCRHVNDLEKEYMKNFDMDFEFIINVESDSDESDYFDDSGRHLAFGLQILMDPWGCEVHQTEAPSEFEDNFKPSHEFEKLSDSSEYLAILEKKLQALRKKNKVVENLAAYRADCIDRLLREGCDLDPVIGDTDSEKLLQD